MTSATFEAAWVGRWSPAGFDAARAAVQRRLQADFELPVFPDIRLLVDPSFAPPGRGHADSTAMIEAQALVVSAGGHRFLAHLEDGVEAACAHGADTLVDDVMDLLGRPWPELILPGGDRGVLSAALDPTGIACWYLNGQAICPIGHLREVFDRYKVPWS
ncbi:hypothetical protein [Frankia sp. Cr1]|uniref:hypothetical protein n=1 Tax=Frankia sp. Cr1 TaxID=3073931 RepID=UPI002AD1FB08|nr:hypothetical protein [Frankia sp. Cr1]